MLDSININLSLLPKQVDSMITKLILSFYGWGICFSWSLDPSAPLHHEFYRYNFKEQAGLLVYLYTRFLCLKSAEKQTSIIENMFSTHQ